MRKDPKSIVIEFGYKTQKFHSRHENKVVETHELAEEMKHTYLELEYHMLLLFSFFINKK